MSEYAFHDVTKYVFDKTTLTLLVKEALWITFRYTSITTAYYHKVAENKIVTIHAPTGICYLTIGCHAGDFYQELVERMNHVQGK